LSGGTCPYEPRASVTSSRPKPHCSEQNRLFSVNVPASTTQAFIVPVVPPMNASQIGASGSPATGNGPVGGEHRDPVAGAHPALAQRRGEPPHPVRRLPVGQAPLRPDQDGLAHLVMAAGRLLDDAGQRNHGALPGGVDSSLGEH
jgi:hypothetical protein